MQNNKKEDLAKLYANKMNSKTGNPILDEVIILPKGIIDVGSYRAFIVGFNCSENSNKDEIKDGK